MEHICIGIVDQDLKKMMLSRYLIEDHNTSWSIMSILNSFQLEYK